MASLLEIRDLHMRFSLFEGLSHVLNGISLSIEKGERVAIVGESGCGKSVTVRAILGLLQQRNVAIEGSIRFHETELLGMAEREWRGIRGSRISMIFQDPMASLNPTFKVRDQLLKVIRRGGRAGSAREAYEIACAGLRRVAIVDPDRILAAYPFQLSGGLAQRVMITMALVNRPELVLADEPGSALDVTVQEQTLRLMHELTQDAGAAVLLITHNLGVVREFAQRVYVMYAGTIVEEADVETLFREPAHPYTRALLEAVPKLTGAGLPRPIEGMVPDYTAAPSGCRFHPRCAFAEDACSSAPPVVELGSGHRVACVLPAKGRVAVPT
ncbi:MAG: ABC transporter ATP-binding protein [Rhodospirillales bacterium]|nr:ABC transporter ATP-binding protein [Rhodospirillales bacterium]MDE0378243.1 ABC transporter ATP-binding protein [Rhodospirillales bacterium]